MSRMSQEKSAKMRSNGLVIGDRRAGHRHPQGAAGQLCEEKHQVRQRHDENSAREASLR